MLHSHSKHTAPVSMSMNRLYIRQHTLTRAVCGLTGGRLKRITCAASVRSAGYGSSFCSRGAGGATMDTWPVSNHVNGCRLTSSGTHALHLKNYFY